LDRGTGLEAIKGVRKACGFSVPAVMITTDHSAALRTMLQHENIGFLGKPIRPATLFEVMLQVLA
jgi:CheY-like chemotaxis protein